MPIPTHGQRTSERTATIDGLPQLLSREGFLRALSITFDRAKSTGIDISVIVLNLDEFRAVNDIFGYETGDKLLVAVSDRLQKTSRRADVVGRTGTDEFGLILSGTGMGELVQIAQRLLQCLTQPYCFGGGELNIYVSIGIASMDKELRSGDCLLQRSSMAMCKAKWRGGNTYCVFEEDMEKKLSMRVVLRNDLQRALRRDEFLLHYQPIVAANGSIASVEALVRWVHPEHGRISPDKFIRVAEEAGQISTLGQWVLRKACQEISQLAKARLFNGRVAVNVSSMEFHHPAFLSSVISALEEAGLHPGQLELELTEGILMKDTQEAVNTIHALNRFGITTALDDFGTGFSGLSYLRHLPISRLKIANTFVKHIATDDLKGFAICQSVILLAKSLGLGVIAEGVETLEQLEILKAQSCDLFQGYYFARPMPFGELIDFLWRRSEVQGPCTTG